MEPHARVEVVDRLAVVDVLDREELRQAEPSNELVAALTG
jgi:hypothetical protein